MLLLTIDDCVGLRGERRDLLHEFDHLLRDALVATQRRARNLHPADREFETAFVTVMMSVAAGALLSAAESPSDVSEADFVATARDALAWAKRRIGDASDPKH